METEHVVPMDGVKEPQDDQFLSENNKVTE
jgi:hypothetical protein